jgi:hypothetical protein
MSDIPVGGPLAIDHLSIGNNWIIQTHDIDDSGTRISGLGANGDEVASAMIDGVLKASHPFKNFASSGNLTIPTVGGVSGGYHRDSLSLTFAPNDWPAMTVNSHQHDSNNHADADMVKYAIGLTIPAGKGVPTLFADIGSTAGLTGMTLDLSCTHAGDDQLGPTGEHLAGNNHNGQLKVTLNYVGTPNITAALTAAGFVDVESKKITGSNTALNATVITATKKITRS